MSAQTLPVVLEPVLVLVLLLVVVLVLELESAAAAATVVPMLAPVSAQPIGSPAGWRLD
jgi:hypothetical protein